MSYRITTTEDGLHTVTIEPLIIEIAGRLGFQADTMTDETYAALVIVKTFLEALLEEGKHASQ